MKFELLILSLVAFAYGSNRLDLTIVNRVLTRLLKDELEALADCAKKEIKCDAGKTYPECLDSDTPFSATANLGEFFILKVMKLDLEGKMQLDDTIFKGLSDFTIKNVKSTVTVVPLGIEFSFTLQWENSIDFESNYEFVDLFYKKNNANTPITGDGPMKVNVETLNIDVVAHKLLGGDMDFLMITPTVDTFHVEFKKLMIGSTDLTQYATTKFTEEFINKKLDLGLLEDYIMKFFNDKLYPELPGKLRAESSILEKLGQCIYNNFPK